MTEVQTGGITLAQAMDVVLAQAEKDSAGAKSEAIAVLDPSKPEDAASVKRIEQYRALRNTRDMLVGQMDDMKNDILADIVARGAQGLQVDGAVVARRQEVQTPRVDGKALKEQLPAIWEKFSKVTEAIRLTVTK